MLQYQLLMTRPDNFYLWYFLSCFVRMIRFYWVSQASCAIYGWNTHSQKYWSPFNLRSYDLHMQVIEISYDSIEKHFRRKNQHLDFSNLAFVCDSSPRPYHITKCNQIILLVLNVMIIDIYIIIDNKLFRKEWVQ